jgi:hypothetical protein
MRITASKIALLQFCQWFGRSEAVWTRGSSPAAERGTRFHQAIAAYTDTRKQVEVEEDIREEYAKACAWVDALPDDGLVTLRTEVAFAWDPAADTAETLDVIDRSYKPTSRLCGTADLVLWHAESEDLVVYDYKTGSADNAGPQLRTLGLMAARAYGVEHATVAALEVRASGVTEVGREELDAFALAGIAGELAEQLAAIETAEPQPGSHCGELYCPARAACPAATESAAQVLGIIPAESLVRRQDFRITDPVRTAEQAIWTVDVLRLMSAWLDAKKDEVKALVPAEGWATEDGRVLREGTYEQSAFDKHKALALVRQLGATEEQIASLHYTFKKSTGLRVSGGPGPPRKRRTKAA